MKYLPSAAASHGWVQVVYSDNQGATWQVAATPHAVADQATVDRYHPWLDVDATGNVHLGFYDTRNSVNRTGVDFYYVVSADGGTSWTEETRVSATVSQNITDGQEWGDYNGLSVSSANRIAMSWTDNRLVSGSPVQASYVGRVTNVMAGPNYGLAVSGASSFDVCAGQALPPVTVNATAFSGFSSPVTLSFPGLNASVFPTATASPNPVTPGSPAVPVTVNLSTAASAPTATYPVTLQGTFAGPPPITRSVGLSVNVTQGVPAAASLTAPANNATNVPISPTLSWGAIPGATSYLVQVASDPAFATIVASGTVSGTTFSPAPALNVSTTYYWRVRAANPCGNGTFSSVFQFTTGVQMCFNGNVPIPDNNAAGANADLAVAAAGVITDLDVSVKITHTWPGDLDLILVHQASSTSVTLGTRLGGTSCDDPNVDVILDDEAPTAITCSNGTSPGIGGIRRPANPLTAFDGLNLASGWRLTAIDRAGQDTGSITEYCLIPTVTPDQIFKNGFEP